jgi:para-nitrobenzyl esterase
VLGFLDLSAYGEKYKYSGNVGMADIVSALTWVKDNISKFGGDPNNVTIIGQSGGGSKVTTLMGMPAAKGLFDKAVAMSGGTVQTTRTKEKAQADTKKLLDTLGYTEKDIDKLVSLSYDELYAAYVKSGINVGPVVDGDYYTDGTYAMSKDIPFMCGNVAGEFSTNYTGLILGVQSQESWLQSTLTLPEDQIRAKYAAKYGDKADAIIAAYQKAYPGHNIADGLYLNNRYNGFFAGTGLALANAMDSYGGKVYNYVQAYDFPMFGGVVPVHTMGDLPFIFHNIDKIPSWVAGDEATAWKVSDEMATALCNFAKTGNPSQKNLNWDNYTTKNVATMVFDRTSSVRYNYDYELFKLMNESAVK